jgi:hypothetical protein
LGLAASHITIATKKMPVAGSKMQTGNYQTAGNCSYMATVRKSLKNAIVKITIGTNRITNGGIPACAGSNGSCFIGTAFYPNRRIYKITSPIF